MRATKTLIVGRYTACTCGCEGKDTWHKEWYKRVIHNIKDESGEADAFGLGSPVAYTLTGTAQFPWGVSRVCFSDGLWFVDASGALDVQNG